MKERPLLMTSENAQKCHDGTKTQTRRLVKPPPPTNIAGLYYRILADGRTFRGYFSGMGEPADVPEIVCPFGSIGSRLWIREAFQYVESGDGSVISYKGNGEDRDLRKIVYTDFECLQPSGVGDLIKDFDDGEHPWKPAIHMPRWAGRTVVEITAIRVERVQEISEEDAKAEGCEAGMIPFLATPGNRPASARIVFSRLWDSIHGHGAWERNEWVWVLPFKKVAL